ncbi:deoxyribodipyrimidine photo-lyase [Tunturiibacter gelidoferens]|uniref:Deoxyribodipyrimidine photo-lyase n=1 Tax=Tunturiibacter gelidiferens TaxID=3069689 RepID=A0ACC5P163_9BACT|nr:deoxyribodipyrimidine photo-lyase [Edaphobacter lichenicola]MBB5340590.1 deoxyribodipyrimidine photo-lyase [Edaphobacter lichenicola]
MPLARSTLPEELLRWSKDSRVTVRRDGGPDPEGRCVVYWMQRAQRGIDNHAVDLAAKVANLLGLPLVVYFAGISNFPHANLRHYVFLNQGLPDIEADLAARNITFVMRRAPRESHQQMLADVHAAFLIGDENPMRVPEQWRKDLASKIKIPFWTVDTDVVVPSKLIEKAQYGAYTIRPRLYRLLPEYLHRYENVHADHAWKRPRGFYVDSVHEDMTRDWKELDRTVLPVEAWKGGTHAALRRLKFFTGELLKDYDTQRNHPETDGTSCMSPYLHYGHIGPITIALAVDAAAKANPKLQTARDSYFNELIAWRELAVNFVRYTANYDSPDCAESWAKTTIAEHARDEREHLYTLHQLENAHTFDDLWNAAQIQMVRYGWMHNYLRMYWAKKILEWTPDVATAMKYSIHLNDKYFLDGRDPNGYAGVAWAILGKFDRAWGTRPIFGKIRYMSGASTGKKFNSKEYIRQMEVLPQQGSLAF